MYKKKLNTPFERIRWEVLKKFNKLPNEKAVKEMTEQDYLYCYINMILDREISYGECSFNTSFDMNEYKRKCGVC